MTSDSPDLIPLFSGSNAITRYTIYDGSVIDFHPRRRLLGSENSSALLFVDDTWPGSFVLSDYLIENGHMIMQKKVLELGAGVALPSYVSCKLGAKKVVISDFPADGVLQNIEDLLIRNHINENVHVTGHIWGESASDMLSWVDDTGFDVILMAELFWKDTYQHHRNLLETVSSTLSKTGIVLVSFAHRPSVDHSPDNDLEFFSLASSEFGLESVHLGTFSKYREAGEDSFIDVQLYSMKWST